MFGGVANEDVGQALCCGGGVNDVGIGAGGGGGVGSWTVCLQDCIIGVCRGVRWAYKGC